MGSFMFGGIGRSLLLGSSSGGGGSNADGDGVNNCEKKTDRGNSSVQHELSDDRGKEVGQQHDDNEYQRRDSSRDTEHVWEDTRDDNYANRKRPPPLNNNNTSTADGNKEDTPQTSSVQTRQQILEERAIKISEARERYFKRRGVATQ